MKELRRPRAPLVDAPSLPNTPSHRLESRPSHMRYAPSPVQRNPSVEKGLVRNAFTALHRRFVEVHRFAAVKYDHPVLKQQNRRSRISQSYHDHWDAPGRDIMLICWPPNQGSTNFIQCCLLIGNCHLKGSDDLFLINLCSTVRTRRKASWTHTLRSNDHKYIMAQNNQ